MEVVERSVQSRLTSTKHESTGYSLGLNFLNLASVFCPHLLLHLHH